MKKILVVDNDQIILTFMTDLLSKKGYQVVTALDGLSALELLKTYTPEIIFIDLIMPRIDGRKLCRLIRGMEKFRAVHLIILSATVAEEQLDVAELGADACIAKGPFQEMAHHILELVSNLECAASSYQAGEVLGIEAVSGRKITAELLSVNRHFGRILDQISEGVLEITFQGQVVFANRAALFLLGVREETLLGTTFSSLFKDTERLRIRDLIRAPGDPSKIIPETNPLRYTDTWLSFRALPVPDSAQTLLVVMNDVTNIERQRQALYQSKNRYQALRHGLAATGHELNQAVAILLDNIEHLESSDRDPEKFKQRIRAIKNAGKRIVETVKKALLADTSTGRHNQ